MASHKGSAQKRIRRCPLGFARCGTRPPRGCEQRRCPSIIPRPSNTQRKVDRNHNPTQTSEETARDLALRSFVEKVTNECGHGRPIKVEGVGRPSSPAGAEGGRGSAQECVRMPSNGLLTAPRLVQCRGH